eukprot:CAMPEP_0182860204 /NCGR_PEP_ID=MMETSP0034_2-20130328/4782_1 /TAXON_ID=156128 /ORGANISM="Nephroselmis pyriformis, Strain CCMP717" /LENGTH=133 /DNA_ID=CAMNT_0024991971 /DNA_START=427 /DNA_END=825 /DNA_ORIENTATION=-
MALCRTARSAYASLFRPAMTAVQTRGFAFSDVGITSGAPMETFDRKVAAYPNAAARASSIPFHSFSRSFRTTPYAEAKAKTDIGILTEAPGEIYERKVGGLNDRLPCPVLAAVPLPVVRRLCFGAGCSPCSDL